MLSRFRTLALAVTLLTLVAAPQAQPQQTYTPPQQPSFQSFSGPAGGFQPPQQRQQAPINPLTAQFDEKIKAAWGFPKTA